MQFASARPISRMVLNVYFSPSDARDRTELPVGSREIGFHGVAVELNAS